MRAVDVIGKKRDGLALTRDEIEAFVQGATTGAWPDYQLSAMLMAIVLRGMTQAETGHLTAAMVHSGIKLDLAEFPGAKVDKHSTGGVGDKTSLVAVPLAAACGCVIPKMSGRGLGHSGGTLDKLESIPGYRVNLSIPELRQALHEVGCALIGQTKEIAPADKILYALRDVTATVESIPLITSSIMSKKIAEGIDGLVLDVKCGAGAFMKTRDTAAALAQALVATGQANGVRTSAFLTAMDAPLGCAVGNSLEVIECLETLKGRGPPDLKQLATTLATEMLHLARPELDRVAAKQQIQDALTSGRALEKLAQVIAHQGGDPAVSDEYGRLPHAEKQVVLRAERAGFVAEIHAEKVGRAAMLLGAGRHKAMDQIDHGVGIVLKVRCGEEVRAGDSLAELHYRDEKHLAEAVAVLRGAYRIGDEKPGPVPQILEVIQSDI